MTQNIELYGLATDLALQLQLPLFTSSKVVVRGGGDWVIFPTGETFMSTSEFGASRAWQEVEATGKNS